MESKTIKQEIEKIMKNIEIPEEEQNRSLKEIIREWFLRDIAAKKKMQHLLTLQDIELTETKNNNTYLKKEKKKYKDLYVKLDKEHKQLQIDFNLLLKEYNKLERKLKK